MNLYLLQLNPKGRQGSPTYDIARGFVVRAESPWHARQLAAENCGDEGPNTWWGQALTSCTFLGFAVDDETEIILRDYNAG